MLIATSAWAQGSGVLTEKGIKGTGSAMAFLDMCELAGHAPAGITERYRESARNGLARAYWDAVERQYRASLQDRMFYLVSQDRWLPFDVEPEACQQITYVSETLIKNYDELAELNKD